MKICVTGHRPKILYGYDLSDPRWISLKEKLKEILTEHNCDEAITGMALGVDTIFALAVLELKSEGYAIKLHCALPCKGQAAQWKKESIQLYEEILKKADIVHYVTNDNYKPIYMQKRNEYMVDSSDEIIAVWNGSTGGTKNCVSYAKKCKKEIIRIIP